MSIEAITFAKKTELGDAESEGARLLFYIIAENTFNDSGVCCVGQAELCYQTRGKLRTIQRRLAALEDAKIIEIKREGGAGKGRKNDRIKILGFREWLTEQRSHDPSGGGAAALLDVEEAEEATRQVGGLGNPPKTHVSRGGNPPMVAGRNKDNRTSNRTRKGGPTDLEVKGNPELPQTITPKHFAWTYWLDRLAAEGKRKLADEIMLAGAMIAPHMFPKAVLKELPKPLKTSQAFADKVIGRAA